MPGGRPRQWTDPEEMYRVGMDYLNDNKRPTKAGLAVALDLSYHGLLNYEKRKEFVDVINKLMAKVIERVEGAMLYDKAGAGAIFWMKNQAGYADRHELDVSGDIIARFESEDEETL